MTRHSLGWMPMLSRVSLSYSYSLNSLSTYLLIVLAFEQFLDELGRQSGL